MRIVRERRLCQYGEKHADARPWLNLFVSTARAAKWASLADVRKTYRSADEVLVGSGRPVVVFDVRGNNYRLVLAIHYNTGVLYVRDFMTHEAYNDQRWKQRH